MADNESASNHERGADENSLNEAHADENQNEFESPAKNQNVDERMNNRDPQQFTQSNFHPRNTFQGRSIDRDHGMRKYARMSGNWDDRFHVSPSKANDKTHTFYKQFFDKPTRSTQGIVLKPKRQLDPYLENETKTRIPPYSKIYKERNVEKEFGWVDNFAVTHSKNNVQIHKNFKEFFDKPVSYNGAVTVATTKGVADVSIATKISTHKPTSTLHILEEDDRGKAVSHLRRE